MNKFKDELTTSDNAQRPIVMIVGNPPATPYYLKLHEALRRKVLAGEIEVIWKPINYDDLEFFVPPKEIEEGKTVEDYVYPQLNFSFEQEGNPGAIRIKDDPDLKKLNASLSIRDIPIIVINTQEVIKPELPIVDLRLVSKKYEGRRFGMPATRYQFDVRVFPNLPSDLYYPEQIYTLRLSSLPENVIHLQANDDRSRDEKRIAFEKIIATRPDIFKLRFSLVPSNTRIDEEFYFENSSVIIDSVKAARAKAGVNYEELINLVPEELKVLFAARFSATQGASDHRCKSGSAQNPLDLGSVEAVILYVDELLAHFQKRDAAPLNIENVETLPEELRREIAELHLNRTKIIGDLNDEIAMKKAELLDLDQQLKKGLAPIREASAELEEQKLLWGLERDRFIVVAEVFIATAAKHIYEITLHEDFNKQGYGFLRFQKEKAAQDARIESALAFLELEDSKSIMRAIASDVRRGEAISLVGASVAVIAQKLIRLVDFKDTVSILEAEDVTRQLLYARAHPFNQPYVSWFQGLKKIISPDVGKYLYASVLNPIVMPKRDDDTNPIDQLDNLLLQIIASTPELYELAHSQDKPALHSGSNGIKSANQSLRTVDVVVASDSATLNF